MRWLSLPLCVMSIVMVISSWFLAQWLPLGGHALLDIYVYTTLAGVLWVHSPLWTAMVPAAGTAISITLLYNYTTPNDPQKAIGCVFTIPTAGAFLCGALLVHPFRRALSRRNTKQYSL